MNPTNALYVALAASLSSCTAPESKNPNLLYIFPDQYRLHALSLWQDAEFRDALSTVADPVHTPNIDKLAKEGLVFTQAASVHPLSSPHRAMLMTGMYPSQNGLGHTNARKGRVNGVRHDVECFTTVLKNAGYATAYVGKTHWERNEALFDKDGNYVGTTEEPGGNYMNDFDTYIPEGKGRHGNDYWYQQLVDNHFNTKAYSNRPELVGGLADGQQYRPHKFTTTSEADVVIRYLQNESNERDATKPFSIIWAINPPHPPYTKLSDCHTDVYEQYYKDMHFEELLLRKNVAVDAESNNKVKRDQLELTAAVYFSLIKSVDDEIGRVLATLEEEGLSQNTIVVFTSDHGELLGSHGTMGKSLMFDESFLVPFIVRYPPYFKHRLEDLKINTVDIMPTMLGLMGLSVNIPSTVAGYDYSQGLISGDYSKQEKPKTSVYLINNAKGVRSDKYSYLVYHDGRYEIYDNVNDPYQLNPLKVDEIPANDLLFLQEELGRWLHQAQDAWVPNRTQSSFIIY